jgi:hypothetical protein
MKNSKTDNSNYGDGFPAEDNYQKKDGIKSSDPSRPFDSGRVQETKAEKKGHNSTGTTMNEPDKYKK